MPRFPRPPRPTGPALCAALLRLAAIGTLAAAVAAAPMPAGPAAAESPATATAAATEPSAAAANALASTTAAATATATTGATGATAVRQMIVAAHPLAAEAGRAMLRAGGSAADAAIAALLVLNVVEPQSAGLGGGGFALVHGPDGLVAWDARETAPAAATAALFLEDGRPLPWIEASESGRAVGVPSLAALMETLHARHGRLPRAMLAIPAEGLAAAGFPVSPRLSAAIAANAERLARTEAGAVFLPGGRVPAPGEIVRQPALAASLAAFARDGAAAFRDGPVAAAILAAVARPPRPGAMAAADLAGYRVVARAPVCHPYRAWRVCGMGPPSSGATTVGQILGLLDRFAPDGFAADDPRLWHLFAEASRLAYADRAVFLADPDFVAVPVRGLLDRAYLAERAALIDPDRASPDRAEAGTPPERAGRSAPAPEGRSAGTTHLSVIDADGLAISLTASIETAFGSGRMAAGILLNNQLTDFAFLPVGEDGRAIANAPAGGKRPRSSMAPTMAWLGDEAAPRLLLGSPGGARIPDYVAGALVGLIDLGLDPAAAAALFRLSQRNSGAVALESGAPAAVAAGLAARGHSVTEAELVSGLAIIRIDPGGIAGGADPRREGRALGD